MKETPCAPGVHCSVNDDGERAGTSHRKLNMILYVQEQMNHNHMVQQNANYDMSET